MINIQKIATLKSTFPSDNKERIYAEIMAWGKNLPLFDETLKTDENRVLGCQSLMYLHAEEKMGRLFFSADSDALISKGLAAILIYLYSGEEAVTILRSPPSFLEELGLLTSLSPGRSNGFASLYQKMQKHALDYLVYQTKA